MKVKRPKWLTPRNEIYYFLIATVLLIAYNVLTPFKDFSSELLSIAHNLIPALFVLVAVGNYFIWKGTGQKAWIILSLGSVAILAGCVLNSYSGNCCAGASRSRLCEDYVYDYVPSTPLPCVDSMLPIALRGPIFLLLGILLYCWAYFKLWGPMEFP